MNKDEKGGNLLSYHEAAAYMQTTHGTVANYVGSGRLRSEKRPGGGKGIRQAVIDSYRTSIRDRHASAQHASEETVGGAFDTARFFADLDRVRELRQISWSDLAKLTHVYVTALMRRRPNPTISTLAPLAIWAGFSLDDYLKREEVEP